MTGTTQSIVLTFEDETSAKAIDTELSGLNVQSHVLKRENLDGSAATWMLIASTAIRTLPKILEGLAKIIEASKVRSIKIGDHEVRNPTAADVRAMRKNVN